MSKITIVEGDIIEIIGGNDLSFAKGEIINIGSKVIQVGKESGVMYGTPKKFEGIESEASIKWLNIEGKKIEIKTIGTFDYHDFLYGEKVQVELISDLFESGEEIDVEVTSNLSLGFKQNFTIKVKGKKATTPFFLIPIKEYDDSIEIYDYTAHLTYCDQVSIKCFGVSIKSKNLNKFFDNDKDTLKPHSYMRNYEELIGLFKTSNSGDKHQMDNYENLFIKINPEIEKLSENFVKYITETDNLNIEKIKQRVTADSIQLWNLAVKQVHGGTSDDRPLYWARNKMQTYLKRHPLFKNDIDFKKSLVKKDTPLDKQIISFEENSRNYKNVSFSKAPIGSKKVLITGFDPFQLDPKYYQFTDPSVGIRTFNPSGIVALTLHKNAELLSKNIFIQTCIFPVRYEDFDNQCVENVINRNFNEVDMIMTSSRNHSTSCDVEKYAIEYRGGFHDNANIGDASTSYDASRFKPNKSSNKTQTTLPQAKIFGSSLIDTLNISGQPIKFDVSSTSTLGSGSNYLSNEVMYRATSIRDTIQKSLPISQRKPVGHFHLRDLGTITQIDSLVIVVKEIVKKVVL